MNRKSEFDSLMPSCVIPSSETSMLKTAGKDVEVEQHLNLQKMLLQVMLSCPWTVEIACFLLL